MRRQPYVDKKKHVGAQSAEFIALGYQDCCTSDESVHSWHECTNSQKTTEERYKFVLRRQTTWGPLGGRRSWTSGSGTHRRTKKLRTAPAFEVETETGTGSTNDKGPWRWTRLCLVIWIITVLCSAVWSTFIVRYVLTNSDGDAERGAFPWAANTTSLWRTVSKGAEFLISSIDPYKETLTGPSGPVMKYMVAFGESMNHVTFLKATRTQTFWPPETPKKINTGAKLKLVHEKGLSVIYIPGTDKIYQGEDWIAAIPLFAVLSLESLAEEHYWLAESCKQYGRVAHWIAPALQLLHIRYGNGHKRLANFVSVLPPPSYTAAYGIFSKSEKYLNLIFSGTFLMQWIDEVKYAEQVLLEMVSHPMILNYLKLNSTHILVTEEVRWALSVTAMGLQPVLAHPETESRVQQFFFGHNSCMWAFVPLTFFMRPCVDANVSSQIVYVASHRQYYVMGNPMTKEVYSYRPHGSDFFAVAFFGTSLTTLGRTWLPSVLRIRTRMPSTVKRSLRKLSCIGPGSGFWLRKGMPLSKKLLSCCRLLALWEEGQFTWKKILTLHDVTVMWPLTRVLSSQVESSAVYFMMEFLEQSVRTLMRNASKVEIKLGDTPLDKHPLIAVHFDMVEILHRHIEMAHRLLSLVKNPDFFSHYARTARFEWYRSAPNVVRAASV